MLFLKTHNLASKNRIQSIGPQTRQLVDSLDGLGSADDRQSDLVDDSRH
jgi:hypothetical protein